MDAPKVTVSASAEQAVAPDSFTLVATVAGVAADAHAARESLALRYSQLEDAAAGLPETVEVHRGELTAWGEAGRRQPRWHVRRSMSLAGTDLSLVGDVVAALATVDDVGIEGPHWNLDRDNPVHAELQADVVRQARARAERYATALGGTLGRLIELSDLGGGFGGGAYAVAAAGFPGEASNIGDLDFTPESVTVHAAITASWSLVLED
jgi:uncharacterized protein YggE